MTVTIFDPANPNANGADGTAGENDAVQQDVENVTGSTSGDSVRGNNLANRLEGLAGADTLIGATAADTLLGGEGDDTLDARDGIRDAVIDCGPGTNDRAVIDLTDLRVSGCESISSFATDDGPPGRIAAGILRIGADGRARVRIACPAGARIRCAGTLTLRRTAAGRVVSRSRYAVRRGRTATRTIAVPEALRGRAAVLRTREPGISRKGPRAFVRSVRVR